ncbi:MAG: DUF4363 family protein [Oscillospiraceae bacterium]|nr:DUF4363 family protein [Oscillospiraceae bacterium]
MRRSWIGLILLLALLAGAVAVTVAMVRIHDPIEGSLNESAQLALAGDWQKAQILFRRASEDWKTWEHFRACFADHTPIEDIDSSFRLLEIYCDAKENAAFAAESRRLARQIAAVGEAHEFVWWNVF